MGRRRIRMRDSKRSSRLQRSSMPPPDGYTGDDSDGFALSFSGGQGILTLRNEPLSEIVTVEQLDLVIPNLAFPFDITGGVGGLRNKRHMLSRLTFTVTLEKLQRFIGSKLPDASLCFNPILRFEKDHVAVMLDYGPKGSRVPITFRLLPMNSHGQIKLLVDDYRTYGPLPASMLLVTTTCIKELAGLTPNGLNIELPEPIKNALFGLLPPRGWRIPDYRKLKLHSLQLMPDRAILDYRHPSYFDGTFPSAFIGDETTEIARTRKQEESNIAHAGDTLLVDGQVESARTTYAKMMDKDPSSPVIISRLASVDVVNHDLRDTACSLVAGALEKFPERNDLKAVLAHGAAINGDTAQEDRILKPLTEKGNTLERLASGLRSGYLLIETDPASAAQALEGALAAERSHRQVLKALMTAQALAGNLERVRTLIPRWIAIHKEARQRAKAYVMVGDILLSDMNQPTEAARHFERAALSDPQNLDAAWGIAEALSRAGEFQRAITQFERLERIYRERENSDGIAQALGAIGEMWLERKEPALALQRLQEAVELAPDNSHLHISLADALLQTSRPADAAGELETALYCAGSESKELWWGETALKLAEIYMADLGDAAAGEPWARAAADFSELEEKAREFLITSLEKQGRHDVVTEELEREFAKSPTAQNAFRIAQALRAQGNTDGVLSSLEHATRVLSDSVEVVDALIDSYREAGRPSELRDALTERVESVIDAERRAQICVEIGKLTLLEFKDPTAAVPWFRRALEDMPALNEANEGLDSALTRMYQQAERLKNDGDFDSARKLFTEVRGAGEDAQTFAAALGEAEAAFKLGDYEDALRAAMKASEGPIALRARATIITAQAFLELDGPDEAVRHLEAAANDVEPADAISLLLSASNICTDNLADENKAELLLKQALAIDPTDGTVDAKLITILESSGKFLALAEHLAVYRGKQEDIDRMKQAAEIFFDEKQPNLAVRVLEELHGMTKDRDSAKMLARAYRKTEQLSDLLALIDVCSTEDGGLDEALIDELEIFADILESQGMMEAAADATDKLASYHDADGMRSARAARLAGQAERKDRAKELWRIAIRHRSNTDWIVQLIDLLSPIEDKSELAELFVRTQGHEDILGNARRLKLMDAQVNIDLQAGRDDEAISGLTAMVKLAPSNDLVWNRLTALMHRRGRWNDLAKQMKLRIHILEKPEELAAATLELGKLVEEKLGDEAGAAETYDRALSFAPDHQPSLLARAALAYRRQSWEVMRELIERIAPENRSPETERWQSALAEHQDRPVKQPDIYSTLMSESLAGEPADDSPPGLSGDTDLEDKLANAFKKLRDDD
ncbi:MAG: tetratricopeptide repeat protein [Proteobacteria bacterium]|nr:tetratricopeptide repeat protein [Pseudomonadota bacterium]